MDVSPMLTIGQLAAYAGVTVRAVRHYHQVGLLPEPERDASGYRRYGAKAAVALLKIRTLADAGVPLSRIDALLHADPAAFAEAIRQVDARLAEEIAEREASRKQIADLAVGDLAGLPPEVVDYMDRLRRLGVSDRMLEGERDGWIIVAAQRPEQVRDWIPAKIASLDDPRYVRLYLLLSELLDSEDAPETLVEEAADIMATLADEAEAAGAILDPSEGDELSNDLLDALAVESDPRARLMRDLLRQRGWDSWTRMDRVPDRPTPAPGAPELSGGPGVSEP